MKGEDKVEGRAGIVSGDDSEGLDVTESRRALHTNGANEGEEVMSEDEDEQDEEVSDEDGESVLSAEDLEEDNGANLEGDSEDLEDSDDDDAENAERYYRQQTLRNTSFGALAVAQEQLDQQDRRDRSSLPATGQPRAMPSGNSKNTTTGDQEKLNALRARLAELHARKRPSSPSSETQPTKRPHETDGKDKSHQSRTSKHAPPTQSTKYQVPRARAVVSTKGHLYDPLSHQRHGIGDPRFSAATAGIVDPERVRRRYAFLSEFEGRERLELRAALGAAKKARKAKGLQRAGTEEEVERLKVEIGRRENRAREETRREKEREVKSKHRAEERGKVREGKTPFYLKTGEVRERVERERVEGLKAKERTRMEERRRKRSEGKEKRRMPGARRSAGAGYGEV